MDKSRYKYRKNSWYSKFFEKSKTKNFLWKAIFDFLFNGSTVVGIFRMYLYEIKM